MRKKLFIVLICSLVSFLASAQDIAPMIEAWKVSDTSQSHKAQVFYDILNRDKDTALHHRILVKLSQYLKDHPDKRLEARILMYEAFGAMVFFFTDHKYTEMLERSIRIAYELRDEQMTAEIYAYYAEMMGANNHLLYNLKAIEIQRRIGFSHFSTVHNRFFIVSNALYHTQEYRQSISYGLECLSFKNKDVEHWLRRIYILQLDILGASYKKLGLYDSSMYYYQKILDTLDVRPDEEYIQKLWTGIAKGNIGQSLALQNKYEPAIPLIKEHLQNSTAYSDWFNVALAQNALAHVYYQQQKYDLALSAWQEAYYWAAKNRSINNAIESSKGIADIYRITGRTDSSFYYYDKYHLFKDTLADNLASSRLSAMNARMTFDNLQGSLDETQMALDKSKYVLNVTLAGISLLVIIALLLYNRYRLKERHKRQTLQRRKEAAEMEVKNAKEQIAGFTSHIIERNDLIITMQDQINLYEQHQHSKLTYESLSQYTLVSEEEWEKFRAEFAKAYPGFLAALRQQLNQITPAEERLSTLIYLQLNNYQIANALGIGKDSVSRSKRRLKQRLNLPEAVTVDEYVINSLVIKS